MISINSSTALQLFFLHAIGRALLIIPCCGTYHEYRFHGNQNTCNFPSTDIIPSISEVVVAVGQLNSLFLFQRFCIEKA